MRLLTGGIVTGGTIKTSGYGSQKRVVLRLLRKYKEVEANRANTLSGILITGAKNARR